MKNQASSIRVEPADRDEISFKLQFDWDFKYND